MVMSMHSWQTTTSSTISIMIFAVWVINKAGGLIYQNDFTRERAKMHKAESLPVER
jgi:hypothetical protein